MATIGDTIRLKATFYGFDEQLVDPETVTVTFYNALKEQIEDPVTLDASNKESTGIYFYDYVIPDGHKRIFYEFCGIIDDLPSVERDEIKITWL